MAEPTTATTEPAAPATPAPPAPTDDKSVPYERFVQVNDQAKAAKKRADELESRLQELEDRDKSELERERSQRERYENELRERDQRLTSLERGGWVKGAASAANFIDPADALGRIDLSTIESETDARRAVKKIAEEAKHLVKAEDPTPPPVPGRVLSGGHPVDPNVPNPSSEENEQFLDELKKASSAGWVSSSTGLMD